MDILLAREHREFTGYLPYVRDSLSEWLFVDIRLAESVLAAMPLIKGAELIAAQFNRYEGKLYLCGAREILGVMRRGAGASGDVAAAIARLFPAGGCEAHMHAPTAAGIGELAQVLSQAAPAVAPVSFAARRAGRAENILLVADDDMYMRLLVKKGVGDGFTVHEVANGADIIDAYKKHAPDILFLDIHMPGSDGTVMVGQILALDPSAYVVMLSADSSRENVEATNKSGAKGFLTKPFNKEKLQEYLRACPTVKL